MAIAIEEGVNLLPCTGGALGKARSAGRVANEEGVNQMAFVGKPLQRQDQLEGLFAHFLMGANCFLASLWAAAMVC